MAGAFSLFLGLFGLGAAGAVDLSRTPWCYLKKRWFIDHLNKKGIPYDDLVVDDVTGVTFYESQKRTSQAYMRKLR